ncbi:amidohydrolase family protein [Aminobacter sp. AP02]|uniref:amidohydrolase family protein n=1 Tax=Aminobacter sp. AP02 TaxID=2135737 RepID=UPI000D6BB831|nr:amidohydrolase family protein [Aminobacter sp. AP02]PWK74012.1 cytosine/adenosine deaminase-related metal-dependent hydrolase [Aminobacter sp. AP02]
MTEITVIRDVETIVAYDPDGDRQVYLHGGDVAFDETGLICVGTRFEGQATTELSGKARMVMPGLIDIHCHSHDEPMAKSIFEDVGTAALWGQAMYEYSGVIDGGEDARAACLTVMLGDLMRSGATTILDIAGANDIWLDIAAQSGARAYLAPGFRQADWVVSDSHRLDFEWNDKAGRDAFARALDFAERARAHPSGRLDGVISPSQVETCRPDLLVDAAEEARNRSMLITVHTAQTMAEHEELLRRTGLTGVQYLEQLGVLGPDVILGHCIFADHHSWTRQRTRNDLVTLADRGTTVAHCPVTFARSGMALETLGAYRRAGVNVAIGTDSYPFNMLEEMRQALICSRLGGKSVFDINTADIFDAATLAGAKALGRDDIGRLSVGAKADLLVIDLDAPTMRPVYDPLRSLLHCAAERAVERVYVDGRLTVNQGKPTQLDYDGAVREMQALQDWACSRAGTYDPRGRNIDELAPKSLPVLER